jgi:hypothetical protein
VIATFSLQLLTAAIGTKRRIRASVGMSAVEGISGNVASGPNPALMILKRHTGMGYQINPKGPFTPP